MSDVIELTVPVKAELRGLVRFAAAILASGADFSVEEIEDLRLAADEICLAVSDPDGGGLMRLRLVADGDLVEISCTVPLDSARRTPEEESEAEWSLRILDALVDEHGQDATDGECKAWLRKRRARPVA